MTSVLNDTDNLNGGAEEVVKQKVDTVDKSHPWGGMGADEFFSTVDYETPPGGEWFIGYSEPFDLDPGVTDLSDLDVLDEASKRLLSSAGEAISVSGEATTDSTASAADRVSATASKLIALLRASTLNSPQ